MIQTKTLLKIKFISLGFAQDCVTHERKGNGWDVQENRSMLIRSKPCGLLVCPGEPLREDSAFQ
jgi:hypothetical protein